MAIPPSPYTRGPETATTDGPGPGARPMVALLAIIIAALLAALLNL